MKPTQNTENWEIEFDERFAGSGTHKIKAFIKSLLDQKDQEIRDYRIMLMTIVRQNGGSLKIEPVHFIRLDPHAQLERWDNPVDKTIEYKLITPTHDRE